MGRSLSIALLCLCALSGVLAQLNFFKTHWHYDHDETNYAIRGYEPTGCTDCPLFLFTTGTWCDFNTEADNIFLKYMASQGYVAAQPEYPNTGDFGYPFSCIGFRNKAEGLYSPDIPHSAASVLCDRSTVNCDNGMAMMGFSQGAQLSSLSAYYNNKVTAAFQYGMGDQANDYHSDQQCFDYYAPGSTSDRNPERVLPADKTLSMNGEHDAVFGCAMDAPTGCRKRTVREQLGNISGVGCETGYDCVQEDGSGWFVVQDDEVKPGGTDVAGHCDTFYSFDKCCDVLNPAFYTNPETNYYSLNYTLNWLSKNGRTD